MSLDVAANVRFEESLLSRRIPTRRGQKHTPGDYWAATDHRLHPYESWLEARWLTLYDYDDEVVAMSTQPFLIQSLSEAGTWKHYPDMFFRLADGTGLVVDVRNPNHLADLDLLRQSERTALLCAEMGFAYRLVGEPDPVWWDNVEWLSGYRRPSTFPAWVLDEIRGLVEEPTTIRALMGLVREPLISRAAMYHLCWHHELGIDMDAPFRDASTRVWGYAHV